jgi:hypothetical protein
VGVLKLFPNGVKPNVFASTTAASSFVVDPFPTTVSESPIRGGPVASSNATKFLRGRADTKVLIDTIVQWFSHHTSGLMVFSRDG